MSSATDTDAATVVWPLGRVFPDCHPPTRFGRSSRTCLISWVVTFAPATRNATWTARPHRRRRSAMPIAVRMPRITNVAETTSSTGSASAHSWPLPYMAPSKAARSRCCPAVVSTKSRHISQTSTVAATAVKRRHDPRARRGPWGGSGAGAGRAGREVGAGAALAGAGGPSRTGGWSGGRWPGGPARQRNGGVRGARGERHGRRLTGLVERPLLRAGDRQRLRGGVGVETHQSTVSDVCGDSGKRSGRHRGELIGRRLREEHRAYAHGTREVGA